MANASLFVGLLGVGLALSASYLAEENPTVRRGVQALLGLADLAVLGLGLMFVLASLGLAAGQGIEPGSVPPPPGLPRGPDRSPAFDALVAMFSSAEGARSFAMLGVTTIVLAALGLAILIPGARRLLARLMPIDADRLVHTVALHLALGLLWLSASVAIFLPLITQTEEQLSELSRATETGGLTMLWLQAFGFIAIAALGVGLGVRRDLGETLSRLGLGRAFHLRWWLAATALALASSWAVDLGWSRLDPETFRNVERLSQAMFGPLLRYGLAGALTIAVSAGLGEELLFRGAAQPRFGLMATSLLFAAVHTQYTVSLALLQVLVVGLLLGLVRQRANTTTAIGVHAAYNFVLVLFALYRPDLGP